LSNSVVVLAEVQVKLRGEYVKAVAESHAIGNGAQTRMPSGHCGV